MSDTQVIFKQMKEFTPKSIKRAWYIKCLTEEPQRRLKLRYRNRSQSTEELKNL